MIGIDFTGIIYASPGVLKHINKRHGKQFNTKSNDTIIMWMRDIIEKPDYIGVYTNKRGQTAVQIIKRMYRTILVGVEIERKNIYMLQLCILSVKRKLIISFKVEK